MDVFKEYDLPFRTYFAKCIEHDCDVHNEIELIWLIKGNATVNCNNRVYHLNDQSIFMIYMNQQHSVKTSEGSILISFRFKKEHLELNNFAFENIPFTNRIYTFKELSDRYHAVPLLITQIIKLLIEPFASPSIRYKIIGYYNMFLYELYHMMLKEKYLDVKTRNSDPFLIRIHTLVEYIYEHAHEKITLDALSKLTNVSTYRLSHFIKDSLGISYSEFLQNTRFDNALWHLENTDYLVQDIAKLCGFSDTKYLNQMMKGRYNMTASKYRAHINTQKRKKASRV